jgi:DNA-binding Lrp family transcriptional regulator
MDELDAQIIELLAKDSRVSFRKIAKETGLSADTVMRRFQKLEEDHVFQPTIKIDLLKLGYEALVFLGVRVATQNSLAQVTEDTLKTPDITAAMKTTGEYDLTVIAAVRNIKHTYEIGEAVSKIPGVMKVVIDQIQLPAGEESTYPPPPWHNLNLSGK